jgi:hypothetical protein
MRSPSSAPRARPSTAPIPSSTAPRPWRGSCALSRGREFANVYTVAATDLLDPDLGTGRREVHDTLQDVRQAIEREGTDVPATEAAVRAEIDAMSPAALAARRAELAEDARNADPTVSRRGTLDGEIRRDREWLRTLAAEREATERLGVGPAGDVAQLRAREAKTAERLARNIEERRGLPEPSPFTEPKPPTARDRLEATLIDRRINVLARQEVTAGRQGESPIPQKALGPFPKDEAARTVWNGAAHSLSTYRLRHNVRDRENPLGRPPRSARGRAEHARVQKRLEAAQRRLRRAQQRSAQRAAAKNLSIGR